MQFFMEMRCRLGSSRFLTWAIYQTWQGRKWRMGYGPRSIAWGTKWMALLGDDKCYLGNGSSQIYGYWFGKSWNLPSWMIEQNFTFNQIKFINKFKTIVQFILISVKQIFVFRRSKIMPLWHIKYLFTYRILFFNS